VSRFSNGWHLEGPHVINWDSELKTTLSLEENEKEVYEHLYVHDLLPPFAPSSPRVKYLPLELAPVVFKELKGIKVFHE